MSEKTQYHPSTLPCAIDVGAEVSTSPLTPTVVQALRDLEAAGVNFMVTIPHAQGSEHTQDASVDDLVKFCANPRAWQASVVRHTDGHLFRSVRARVTFSRMSVALAVQMKGLGF